MMLKTKISECMALTDRIMTDHFQFHHDILYQHLDENCLWIGSCDSEYYMGRDKIVEILNQEQDDLPRITLILKEFHCVSQDRNSCTIVGRYVGVTDEASGEIFSDRQRVTFCWKEQNGKLMLMHMHVSNPLQIVQENEIFPHEISKYTGEYMERLIAERTKQMGSIYVKDTSNVNHRVQIGKIIYLEAFNNETLIHTSDGDIFARMQMSTLEKCANEEDANTIIRVHKSFCVNKYHVENIQRYELKLHGGHSIPVSRTNYQEIKEKLQLKERQDERGK